GLAFIILSMTRPQLGTILEMTTRRGIDLIFVIDTSVSMLAEDIKPNRLERAKFAVAEMIDALEGDRVGIVGFAGAAFVQCPLTLDYGAAKMHIDALDVGSVPAQGTAIGEAIKVAHRAFTVKERQSKVIVLLTDGEDHEGNPVEAAREAADDGVRVDIIGIGTPDGELIPVRNEDGSIDYKRDEDGRVVKTVLHEAALSEVAETGKGRYYRLTSGGGEIKDILTTISKMEKGEIGSRRMTRYEERFQYPLFVALLLLAGEILISERRKR
ncbi:MAG: VWA domain-containing protein, partial [Candidatus Latescibacteria bacterium]|nr:VWA domain-containing protein [Candidatus Latescibacterota bacterium]